MRSLLLPLIGVFALQGCVYYHYDGNGDGPCDGRCDDWDDLWGDDDDAGDTGAGDIDAGLSFYPQTASPGDTLIGYVTAEIDLTGAVDVDLFGPARVNAVDVRADELLVSLSVDADAPITSVDLLVTFDGGATAWLPAALTIVHEGGDGGGTPPGGEPCDE